MNVWMDLETYSVCSIFGQSSFRSRIDVQGYTLIRAHDQVRSHLHPLPSSWLFESSGNVIEFVLLLLLLSDDHLSSLSISYLNYLKYFHEARYASFIRYPNCLLILDLLNKSDQFRTMIESQETSQALSDKFIQHWITLSGRLNKLNPDACENGRDSNRFLDQLNAAPEGRVGFRETGDGNGETGSMNGNSPWDLKESCIWEYSLYDSLWGVSFSQGGAQPGAGTFRCGRQ